MSAPAVLISQDQFDRWASAPAPEGIDPQVWADAQKTRVQNQRPWDEEALRRLPAYMSGLVRDQRAVQEQQESGQEAA